MSWAVLSPTPEFLNHAVFQLPSIIKTHLPFNECVYILPEWYYEVVASWTVENDKCSCPIKRLKSGDPELD